MWVDQWQVTLRCSNPTKIKLIKIVLRQVPSIVQTDVSQGDHERAREREKERERERERLRRCVTR